MIGWKSVLKDDIYLLCLLFVCVCFSNGHETEKIILSRGCTVNKANTFMHLSTESIYFKLETSSKHGTCDEVDI